MQGVLTILLTRVDKGTYGPYRPAARVYTGAYLTIFLQQEEECRQNTTPH
jgi:hypothetical protein